MQPESDVDHLLDEALAHHQAGHANQAEIGYRTVLKQCPAHPDALNFLAVLLQDRNQPADAKELLLQALAAEPQFPEALANLARTEIALGAFPAAADAARAAITLDLDIFEAHQHLGRALIEMNEPAEALNALSRARELRSEDRETCVLEACALLALGRDADADSLCQHALSEDAPARLLLLYANATLKAGRQSEALRLYQRILAADPDNPKALVGAAFCHDALQMPRETVEASRAALRRCGDQPEVSLLLCRALARLGRFDEAEAVARSVLDSHPRPVGPLRELALMGRLHDPAGIQHLDQLLKDPAAPASDRAAAGFALGLIRDRAGAYDDAFAAYDLANGLVRAELLASGKGFDREALRRLTDWLITTFPGTGQPLCADPTPSERLVFIVGMPRSGTSLVEQIVASHPDVHGAGERKFVGELVERLNGGSALVPPSAWNADKVALELANYFRQVEAIGGTCARIADKMPDNLYLLGHIALLFPRAHVILCSRDMRDVCLSAYFQNFGDNLAWSYALEDCAVQAQETARLADHWQRTSALRIHKVEYEALVADIDGEARRLIEFLDLDWTPECLAFHKTERPNLTASFWQVRQPLYSTSSGRWKHYRAHLTPLIFGLLGLVPDPDPEDWRRLVTAPEKARAIGYAHHLAGRLDAASAIYDALIDHDPSDALALHLRGIVAMNLGKLAEATALLQRAALISPDTAPVWADLARAHLAAGDWRQAVEAARAAVAKDPVFTDGWCQLAYSLAESDNKAEAVEPARKAYALVPDGRDTLICLGTILHQTGAFKESEQIWQRAARLFPSDGEAKLGLSRSLTELGRHEESISLARALVEQYPDRMNATLHLAWVYLRAQNVIGAVALLAHLADRGELPVNGLLLLAYSEEMAGDRDRAEQHYKEVLAQDPLNGEALGGLAMMGRLTFDEPTLERAQEILQRPGSPEDKISVAFALGDEFERRGDFRTSFKHYEQANLLMARTRPSMLVETQLHETQQIVDACIRTFSRHTIGLLKGLGHESEAPTFIVGLPRSGTTLVEQIAASHPNVFGLGEKGDFLELLGAEARSMLLDSPEQWNPTRLSEAVQGFLEGLHAEGGGAARIINKLPNNIYWLGHIKALFPNARVILCRRDLRDVCWSCYSRFFLDRGMAWSDTQQATAAYARQVERLIDHWHQVLEGEFLEIFYEDVVEDIEKEARRLIAYLGLPWDAACLSFYKTKRVVMTASHAQVRQPLYAKAVGRWRPYRPYLTPMLDGLKGLIPEDD